MYQSAECCLENRVKNHVGQSYGVKGSGGGGSKRLLEDAGWGGVPCSLWCVESLTLGDAQ